VGCGTGSFLPVLAARADRVVGIDPLAKETEATRRATAERLPFPDATFGLAVCLDVLEHVDDEAALTELARVVRPGGLLIVTVPAFSWLWSARDDAAAHRRRYGRAQLTQVLEAAGFDVAEIAYYQFFLFPLVVASRWAARRRPDVLEHEHFPAPFLNRALTFVNTLEVRFGSRVKWPFGSTLAVAARRRS
jgi:SAM-dependent methyltransferase